MTRAAVVIAVSALVACDRAAPAAAPSLRVTIAAPGALPATVAATIVAPIEAALARVPGGVHVRSTAAIERATFELTGDRLDDVAIRAAVDRMRVTLPSGTAPPVIEWIDPTARRVLVAIGHATAVEAGERLIELGRIAGVRVREPCGDAEAELVITADPTRLHGRGVTLVEMVARLEVVALRHRDRLAELGAVELAPGVTVADVATIGTGAAVGCRASLDGAAAALAWLELDRGVALPPGVRGLDGAAVHGELTVDAAEVTRVIAAAHGAIATPRWFATWFDPAQDRLTISVGLARGVRGGEVATAIDHAVGAIGPIAPGRWRGAELVVATAIVRGPDAREAGLRRVAALRATAGVASAGCEPCGVHASSVVRVHGGRLATIGARADDVARLVEIAEGGVVVIAAPPVRLTVPDDADLMALMLRSDDGLVPAGELVAIDDQEVPVGHLRVDGEPAVELWARGAPGTTVAALRRLVEAQGR